ncbi:MAG TPA: Maf family protein [Xanthobacteraceae bacterium]
MPLWLAPDPLLLASRSSGRKTLLEAAGIPVEVYPANLDERGLEAGAKLSAPDMNAAMLARAKALAVARLHPGRLVLGADQTLALGTDRFVKPADRAAACAQLRALSGRTHELHSAIAFVKDATPLFEYSGTARLTMRAFSDHFLDLYLDAIETAATESVGGYQLEAVGAQLFERVDGDYFTIVGLPLLHALEFLRRCGCLLA